MKKSGRNRPHQLTGQRVDTYSLLCPIYVSCALHPGPAGAHLEAALVRRALLHARVELLHARLRGGDRLLEPVARVLLVRLRDEVRVRAGEVQLRVRVQHRLSARALGLGKHGERVPVATKSVIFPFKELCI